MNVFRKANLRLGAVVLAALAAAVIVLEAQGPGFFSKIYLGSANVIIQAGTGSPESVVSGSVGDIYLQTDGSTGTTLWVKEAGAATTTGWEAKGAGFATSAELAAALSDETGTGAVVFANTPTLVTPNIGTATGTEVVLDQAGADGYIQQWRSTDVAHGMTDFMTTTTYGAIGKDSPTNGGLQMTGGTAAGVALVFRGFATTMDTSAAATSSQGIINYRTYKKSGTSVVAPDTNAWIFTIQSQAASRFLFREDGNAYADVGWTTFDTHDDLALLKSLEFHATPQASPFKVKWDLPQYSKADLQAADVVQFDDATPGRAMINLSKMPMLLSGAIRQEAQAREAADIAKANQIADQANQIAALRQQVEHLQAMMNDVAAGRPVLVSGAAATSNQATQPALLMVMILACAVAYQRQRGRV